MIRDLTISVTKAICIILMVVGHSGCPNEYSSIIYMFHMPCFFVCSGFLFKEKYFSEPKQYVFNKVKGLWWPFVKWSFIFLLFHNLLAKMHVYDTMLEGGEILKEVLSILIMIDSEQLLGGFWFLKQLLYASIISYFSLRAIVRWNLKQNIFLPLLILLYLLLAFVFSVSSVRIPTISSITMLSSAYFVFGYCYRKYGFVKDNWILGLIALVLLVVISFFFTGSMSVVGYDIFIYFVVSLIGCFGLLNLVSVIKWKFLVDVFDYIGGKTLYILVFHFLSFKFVTLLLIWCYDLPIENLSVFPVLNIAGYWILYSVAGVVFPLIIWEIIEKSKKQAKILCTFK